MFSKSSLMLTGKFIQNNPFLRFKAFEFWLKSRMSFEKQIWQPATNSVTGISLL
jgi:hypothetical protein